MLATRRRSDDKHGGDPTAPPVRIHERVIQLDTFPGLDPGREANDRSALFRSIGAALGQPIGRKDQMFWVG